MTLIWVDAQLPPSLARWIAGQFACQCQHVDELNLREAADLQIARAAVGAGAIILTKDSDFSHLEGREPQPRVIWLRMGNASNADLRRHLSRHLQSALDDLERGSATVEI